MNWNDRGVLITGASRGLGRALALTLAARGARLVLVAREPGPLEATAQAIRAQGGEAHALAFDVADKGSIYPLAGAAQALVGRVDVVIHNASALGPAPLRALLDTDCEDLERALAVNVIGPFRLTKALAGAMALHGEGLVVHITSDASVEAYPAWGAYGVSKAAFDHLARIFAVELDPMGVRFLAVDPGDMDTQLHAEAVPDADRAGLQDPADVAPRLVQLLERAHELPNGARVALAAHEPVHEAAR
jgi:NAD(P)-dependent dehydrogenase (short-subunit alcohol dehydrogenase family)